MHCALPPGQGICIFFLIAIVASYESGGNMDAQSLTNILGLLRKLRENPDESSLTALKRWAGDGASEENLLRVASYLIEQIKIARQIINESQLSGEAKAGVNGTLKGLIDAFSLPNLGRPINLSLRDIPGSISNFAILLSASGLSDQPDIPKDMRELANEVREAIAQFNDPQIDPAVKDVAQRHLQILATMLDHIPIFGLEAAMTAYFELMMKIRRTDSGAGEPSHKKTQGLWEKMKGWGSRMDDADKIINSAVKIGEKAEKAIGLLDYIPS